VITGAIPHIDFEFDLILNSKKHHHSHNKWDDFDEEKYRYCCEAVLELKPNSINIEKNAFENNGDSLIYILSENMAKFHFHTNNL
jgi:dihydroxyacetone kinase-like predicted kinase